MPENQTQPNSSDRSPSGGGPGVGKDAPASGPGADDVGRRPSDTEAAHQADEGGRSLRTEERRSFHNEDDLEGPRPLATRRHADYGGDEGRSSAGLPDEAMRTPAEPDGDGPPRPPAGPGPT